MSKCFKAANEALAEGRSIVIDNMNKTAKVRAQWIAIARKHGIPCRCVYLNVPKHVAFHLNKFRYVSASLFLCKKLLPESDSTGTSADRDGRKVPDMVLHAFYKNLELPSSSEGFAEVITKPFTLVPFLSKTEQDLFLSYL